jgi:hypothetical protein
MVDRTDVLSAMLFAVSPVVAIMIFIATAGNGLIANLALTFILLLIFLYPAYWAFSIPRVLAIRMYRMQAFGMGLICLALLAAFWIRPALRFHLLSL